MKFLFFIIFFAVSFAFYHTAIADTVEEVGVVLNQIRIENSKHPLKKSDELTLAAQDHADDMNGQHYFSHTGKNGSDHFGRIRRSGFNACYTAENIARGQKNVTTVMRDWMNSPGHKANILSGRPTHYGIGVSGNVWVMTFGSKC